MLLRQVREATHLRYLNTSPLNPSRRRPHATITMCLEISAPLFRERQWKMPIFSGRVVPKPPNVS